MPPIPVAKLENNVPFCTLEPRFLNASVIPPTEPTAVPNPDVIASLLEPSCPNAELIVPSPDCSPPKDSEIFEPGSAFPTS
ncbi:hypothetical protein AAHR16_14395 [Listeria monocytogenes]